MPNDHIITSYEVRGSIMNVNVSPLPTDCIKIIDENISIYVLII